MLLKLFERLSRNMYVDSLTVGRYNLTGGIAHLVEMAVRAGEAFRQPTER
jgi:hypothetical protein